jgi:DNA-binding CsgD family transcriptional regulator
MPPANPGEGAVIERCAGIVSDDLSFEAAFERALSLHDSDLFPFERARTEQAYGERLRRAGQRGRARELLRAALVVFDDLGATAWSSRARSELAASGERLRSTAEARESLTPREMQVALAVSEGATNNEVAAALYLTPKTVEYHLTRVYRKLGVRSRAELVRQFAGSAET